MGFFSKQFVLYSAIQSGYNFIALVAIFVSVISASYYLKIIKTFFIDFDSKELKVATSHRIVQDKLRLKKEDQDLNLDLLPTVLPAVAALPAVEGDNFYSAAATRSLTKPEEYNNNNYPNYDKRISNSHSFIISTLTMSILFFIFKPSLILNITQLLSLSLFYI